mmetsp:Transcript_21073/g.23430  ORF Transcript_21073/g.23430 Transcript_21073/m.23430 type:complete len:264 (-) Transcript_21073:47-838(-)|eukprot:CAMPEP_0194148294 /NCGR_PEP_ID=MMETSP0152-20130528/31422_1 /TAXON_ID=1049557 /ORGANISM="Thalassiothrix antarctica, Strain L6-D1" /LENGTH=263 /DNA_ID=CAMNT_0038849715 /DNA_START=31 /DNA_END=822 /DNA_ORIENTATION=+
MSTESISTKGKKNKLEKIFELQAENKGLKEENRSLRKKLQIAKSGYPLGTHSEEESVSSANEEKLMEAMKALKRVTVKQESHLNAMRSKSEHSRKQVAERDRTISKLQQEIDTLRATHATIRESENSDINLLRSKVEELEIRCIEQENQNIMLVSQVEDSEGKVSKLEKQLETARKLVGQNESFMNLKSSNSCISGLDASKLRRELASKIEQIVLLEFDLEMCREELHELRQRKPKLDEDDDDYQEDFYLDDEEEDENIAGFS